MSLRVKINILITLLMLVFIGSTTAIQLRDAKQQIQEEITAGTKVANQLLPYFLATHIPPHPWKQHRRRPPLHYPCGSTSDSTFRSAHSRLNRAAGVTTVRAESNFADTLPSKIPTFVPSRAFPARFGRKDLRRRRIFHGKAQFSGEKALKKCHPALSPGSSAGARA